MSQPYLVSSKNLLPSEQSKQESYATGYLSANVIKWIGFVLSAVYYLGAVFFPEHPVLRYIGCSAFPIFAYFISEGYEHTRNKVKYGYRLWGTGLLTQIPYYLCFPDTYGGLFPVFNPILTYALGYLLIWSYDQIKTEFSEVPQLKWILLILISAPFGVSAYYLPFFHGIYGLAVVVIFWILREDFFDSAFVNYILLYLFRWQEMWSIPGFMLIGGTYNHKKGKRHAWLSYLSFPVLLFLYWIIKQGKGGLL